MGFMEPRMVPLRLLIIADDPLVRAGLALLLAPQPDCTVIGQLAADAVLLASLPLYQPDVVLWDFGWGAGLQTVPPQPELEAPFLERLTEIHEAGYRVLMLLPDETAVGPLWSAGVRGVIGREAAASTIAAALHAVAQGLTVLDSPWSQALFTLSVPPQPPPDDALTPREREVLQLVAEGLPNKTIAARLRISEHTVKFHLNALMTKLGAQSRTEVVVRATRLGWLAL